MVKHLPIIHETSVAHHRATIGDGTRIWHFCHLMEGAVIGDGCVLGHGVFVGRDVTVGSGCRIQNHVSLFKGVTLEDNVFIGPGAVFTNVKRPRADQQQEFLPTLVKNGATIGANATILCGVTIGEGALVGAGAVVTKDVRDGSTVLGVPAREV